MSSVKEELVHMTLEEIRQAHERGDYGKTDWERVAALTDEEIEEAVRNDPDAAPILGPDFWKNAILVKPRRKVDIHIRLDSDIVEFFKKDGARYQSRINAVLRTYVEACKEKST